MPETMSAELTVGGPVPRAPVPLLCRAIRREAVCLDWGADPDGHFRPRTGADLAAALTPAGRLVLTDPEAVWGRSEALEEWLRDHAVAYDRHTGPGGGHDATLVRHRPGLGTREGPSDEGQEPLVPEYRVREARDRLRAGDVAGALPVLEALAPDVPGLPPLTFTDDGHPPGDRERAPAGPPPGGP